MKKITTLLLILFSIVIYGGEEYLLLPYNNKIIKINQSASKVNVVDEISTYRYTTDLFYWNGEVFTNEVTQNPLIQFSKNSSYGIILYNNDNNSYKSYKKLIEGSYYKIAFLQNNLICFSKIYKEHKGFKIDIYGFDGQKASLFKSIYINGIISDYKSFDTSLYLSSITLDKKMNVVSKMYIENEKLIYIRIYERNKKNDFIKFLKNSEDEIYIYNSSLLNGNNNKVILKFNKNQREFKQVFQDDSGFVFFGSGFMKEEKIYISILDKNKKSSIIRISKNNHFKIINNISTIYSIYNVNDQYAICLGYNYYLDRKFILYKYDFYKEKSYKIKCE